MELCNFFSCNKNIALQGVWEMGRLCIENGKEPMEICVFPAQFCSEFMTLRN